jgi:Transposase DDE domain
MRELPDNLSRSPLPEFPMILLESLPTIKTFTRPLATITSALLLTRCLTGFFDHRRRMSATQAAAAIRTNTCHRANVGRYLARLGRQRNWQLLETAVYQLLQLESRTGIWSLLLDQTHVGQSGTKTQNTFRRGNYRPRTKRSNRHQKKVPRRSCHAFVMALLLSPSGYRIPMCRCYLTKNYAAAKGLTYRTQTQLAAELILAAPIPAQAKVVVLGDTAFDAQVIRAACEKRNYSWVVPMNPERVLAGPQGKRPKVRSLVTGLCTQDFRAVRLDPDQGEGRRCRRLSRYRVGSKVKRRTYYVHGEDRDIHSVGKVLVVFSTMEQPTANKSVLVQKILMTNDRTLDAAAVVELYDRRWQIELFFKELKSTLGFACYSFRQFEKVAGWTQVCLVAFVYLEWRRAKRLRVRDLSASERRVWESQRSFGGVQAVRQWSEQYELGKLQKLLSTPTGRRRLRRLLRNAHPIEYRVSA